MNALKEIILRLIRNDGPITLAQYMNLVLQHPSHGYYATRDPLGRDFITAPEVSQIFGELIGLFLVQAWEDRGSPKAFHLVELGPGRGTLMADIFRAAKIRPAFVDAAHVTLVETSPALRDVQARNLRHVEIAWASTMEDIPADAPLFVVANEFFDALPIRQFEMVNGIWHERMVGAEGDTLHIRLMPNPIPFNGIPLEAPHGAVVEMSVAALGRASYLAERIVEQGGVALIVDYGHTATGFGDTFQAVKAHHYTDPFAEPGDADLTAHVDFERLAEFARAADALVHGPVPQGAFLEALGIHMRAENLKRATPREAADIDAAVARLTGPEQMGTLFKVMAISDGHFRELPGFLR